MILLTLGLLILLLVGFKLFPEYTVEISLIVLGIELLCMGLYYAITNEVKRIVRKYINGLREE